jgi:hypothetical protein
VRGDAASATTDIKQFPVAERQGKNREREPVPALIGLKIPFGVQGIRWYRRYRIHRSGNLESACSTGVFSLKQDRTANGTVYS